MIGWPREKRGAVCLKNHRVLPATHEDYEKGQEHKNKEVKSVMRVKELLNKLFPALLSLWKTMKSSQF